MNIRRFFGNNTREVMQQVRESLGPEALIISNRRINDGIEILATANEIDTQNLDEVNTSVHHAPADSTIKALNPDVDRAPAKSSAHTNSYLAFQPSPAESSSTVSSPITPSSASASLNSSAPALPGSSSASFDAAYLTTASSSLPNHELKESINALRGSLETRIEGLMWGKGLMREPVGAGLFRSLLDIGFSTSLVRALLEFMPKNLDADSALDWARNELIMHLPILQQEDEWWGKGGVFALVGPTGVGKTTTLAKLAARCASRVGREYVAMLTTDHFRIGAHEQLQIYGRLMSIPTHSVADLNELEQVFTKLSHCKIILIDTTGLSQRDRNVAKQIAFFCKAQRPILRLLVLNAASQGDTLEEVAKAYCKDSEEVAGCIITKIDEAPRIATALDIAVRHRLPILYITTGQKVPENLEVPRAAKLVDLAFEVLEHETSLFSPSEADLAALWAASHTDSGKDARNAARRLQLLAAAILPPSKDTHSFDTQPLQAAIDWLNGDTACRLAGELWLAYRLANASVEDLTFKPLNKVREAFAETCSRYLLFFHGKTSLKTPELSNAKLLATLLMSDRGVLLAAPVQQLLLAHGNLSSFGYHADTTNIHDVIVAQAAYLSQHTQQLPAVHIIEAQAGQLKPPFDDPDYLWLIRSRGTTRIIHDECPTIVQAVAKTLSYLPLGKASQLPPGIFKKEELELTLWVAGTSISQKIEQANHSNYRLICVKLVNERTNDVVKFLYGITNLPLAQVPAATIANWLLQTESAKVALRFITNAWQVIPSSEGADRLMRQALMAGQLGVAATQLAHTPEAAVLHGPLCRLAGNAKKLSTRALPQALIRFFSLLEMTH